ncbi:unnamed protein product, partial [Owenia fusiformis]
TFKGRGQPIRYLLADNDIPHEDSIIQGFSEAAAADAKVNPLTLDKIFSDSFDKDYSYTEEWKKLKSEVPFNVLPVLKTPEGPVISQTNAILRYLARKYDLYGTTEDDVTQIDILIEHESEGREQIYVRGYSDYHATQREKLVRFILPDNLRPLENELKKNNGGTGFLVGDKISFADYKIADFLDTCLAVDSTILDPYPLLKAYLERILLRPKIAELRGKEPYKSMTFLGCRII